MNRIHVVALGSTAAVHACALVQALKALRDPAPHLVSVIDSMPLADVRERCRGAGFPDREIDAAITVDDFLHLPTPFDERFDFADPRNRWAAEIMTDPALQALARRPDLPGCAGTPALAAARVEGHHVMVRGFLERMVHRLTGRGADRPGLAPGIRAVLLTTFRGGTGTGAALRLGAVLRPLLPAQSTVHLMAHMPCVYGGDDRAIANAVAALKEIVATHAQGATVTLRAGEVALPPPFSTVTPIFARNQDGTSQDAAGALAMTVALLCSYLRPETQRQRNARLVDLVDVGGWDTDARPTHVRLETVSIVRAQHPGLREFLALHALRCGVRARLDRLDAGAGATPDEQRRVRDAVERTVHELDLAPTPLARRLEPANAAVTELSRAFDGLAHEVMGADATAIRARMGRVPAEVNAILERHARRRRGDSARIRDGLVADVERHLRDAFAAEPHLLADALGAVADHVGTVGAAALEAARTAQQQREAVNRELPTAMGDVMEPRRRFAILVSRDEIVRDAATRARQLLQAAATARMRSEVFDTLAKEVLIGDASVQAHLRRAAEQVLATGRRELGALMAEAEAEHEALDRRLALHASHVEHALQQRPGESHRSLAAGLDAALATSAPLDALVAGRRRLAEAVDEMAAHLPQYAARPLAVLLEDEAAMGAVVARLRAVRPWAELDAVLEEQLGLTNRRDALVVLEVPGGAEGLLAQRLLRARVVEAASQIVDSGDDEIRLSYLRDGLPYAVLSGLARFETRYEDYLRGANRVTPHTMRGAHGLPPLRWAAEPVALQSRRLARLAAAVLPERLAARPAGSWVVLHEEQVQPGFAVTREDVHQTFEALVAWLSTRADVRAELQARLDDALDRDRGAWIATVQAAYHQASGADRDLLRAVLHRHRVDPDARPARPNGHDPTGMPARHAVSIATGRSSTGS